MAQRADDQENARELAEMRAIAAGDQRAFARVVDRESARLLRFVSGLLGSIEEAEEVAQETLLSLWETAARWTPEARLATWLHRVAYNRAIDRLRRRREFVDDSALQDVPDDTAAPDERMLAGEAAAAVGEALDQLPHRQRSAVLLFHIQDLSQAEAARVLGISESALESLLARARRSMRAWLLAKETERE